MKQNYIVIKRIGPRPSQSNPGSKYWTIIFKGESDGLSYETHVDISMENFSKWEPVVFSTDKQIVGNLRVKSIKDKLINADSLPEVLGVVASPAKYIEPAKNNFGNLFDI